MDDKEEYEYQMKLREMNRNELMYEITKEHREVRNLRKYIKSLQEQNRQLQRELRNVE